MDNLKGIHWDQNKYNKEMNLGNYLDMHMVEIFHNMNSRFLDY